jgi:lipopolysaccharide export system protein LptA
MALFVPRLRRWFLAGAVLVTLLVAGAYYIARWKVENALKQVPGKMGIEIQQTAQGFSISKSEAGRTLFKIQASKAVKYKEGGRVELHDVAITLYGHDSTRFDQIYGADFEFDPQSGEVVAKGEVQIDLEANPEGLLRPDQAIPKELKNPIHLKTSGLIFNQKTGDAQTKEIVEFRIPQAKGTAVGANYSAKEGSLLLRSQVQIDFVGPQATTLTAARATLMKAPQTVLLERIVAVQGEKRLQSDEATLYLDKNSTLERILARGNVQADSEGAAPSHLRAAQLEVLMSGRENIVRSAIFSGDVQMENFGDSLTRGSAGRVALMFSGKNLLSSIHTEENVKFVEHPKEAQSGTQDTELSAPAVDFFFSKSRRLERAETSGPPQIVMRPADPGAPQQQTVITAGKFEAHFDAAGLTSIHGAPDARIVNATAGQPDRVSTSDSADASFHPGKGIDSIVQQGNFSYVDGDRKAWGSRARYTPGDQMLTLAGSPRVSEGGMTTTANSMRVNRATGDALAEGDVKSTYSDLKPQPNGAALASSSPIHVTSRTMTANKSPAVALYSGGARLWQDANVIEAPSIQFDRDHRSVVAAAAGGKTVSMVLMHADKNNKVSPLTVHSSHLAYTDNERKAHFEGDVVAGWVDMTITARSMDVFLQPSGQAGAAGPGKLERVVAKDKVVIVQPKRQGNGEQLVYTAADDKFVLTGGPPSIFDAEQGKITGVSLTLFRHDDRVLVEGNAASPVVTQTRVAR